MSTTGFLIFESICILGIVGCFYWALRIINSPAHPEDMDQDEAPVTTRDILRIFVKTYRSQKHRHEVHKG